MARKNSVPNYSELITVTYAALKALGGSGKNDEINNKAAEILGLSDDVLEVPHLNSSTVMTLTFRSVRVGLSMTTTRWGRSIPMPSIRIPLDSIRPL